MYKKNIDITITNIYNHNKIIEKDLYARKNNIIHLVLTEQLVNFKDFKKLVSVSSKQYFKSVILGNYKNVFFENTRSLQYYHLNYGRLFFFKQRRFDIFSYFFFNKFKNRYMFRGQRNKILSIFNNVLTQFKFKVHLNFQNFLKILLFLIRPIFGYKRRRKAKQLFIVPVPLK